MCPLGGMNAAVVSVRGRRDRRPWRDALQMRWRTKAARGWGGIENYGSKTAKGGRGEKRGEGGEQMDGYDGVVQLLAVKCRWSEVTRRRSKSIGRLVAR